MKLHHALAAGYLCLVLLLNACVVKKPMEPVVNVVEEVEKEDPVVTLGEEKPEPVKEVIMPKPFMIRIAEECAYDIYRKDSLKVNTPLYIYQLDAKFTKPTGSFTVRVSNYDVTKVSADSLLFTNFSPDSTWQRTLVDSALVKITCIYEVPGSSKHPLPTCMSNSYVIRERQLSNNLNYKMCY